MTLTLLQGDPLLTHSSALMIGVNSRGQVEVSSLEARLRDHFPVFYGEYRRMGRSQKLTGGSIWFFGEASPALFGAVVRDSAGGITRTRYVEQVFLNLQGHIQDYPVQSLCIAPLAPEDQWHHMIPWLAEFLPRLPLRITLYERDLPGIPAEDDSFSGQD